MIRAINIMKTLHIIFCVYACIKRKFYLPVHIISISGASLEPKVLRYSEFWTFGVARAAQYCVGHNMKRGWPRCWNTSLLTETCNHIINNFNFMKSLTAGLNISQQCPVFSAEQVVLKVQMGCIPISPCFRI
jgi:hypothetical protein